MLCSSAKHFVLTVPLSNQSIQVNRYQQVSCQKSGKPDEMLGGGGGGG